MENNKPNIEFCQYASGHCPEVSSAISNKVLFLYPSKPSIIASTIENCIKTNNSFISWENLQTHGKIIFCEICKAIYASNYLICDITTLNFNVLFEIGFIIGISKPFIPIFDTSFGENKNLLSKIGILDTVGYKPFLNCEDISKIAEEGPAPITFQRGTGIDTFAPIYYLKSPLDTDGSIKITSILKKAWFNFRTYDAVERVRLPLNIAVKEVDKSRAIVASLMSPDRGELATIHNARCAFVAGLAMASQKRVLLLQEGRNVHPIDYKDIIQEYDDPSQIAPILDTFYRELVSTLQTPVKNIESIQRSILEDIDIGDIAAENEIENLKTYYVRTGQFTEARKGHTQLVVGRKGSGKTALFYALRHQIGPHRTGNIVLDLKPDGYQFAKLRDTILKKFSEAIRQHTLIAIWDYVLLLELAHKILTDKKEIKLAHNNHETLQLWNKIRDEYKLHRNIEEGDFSERLSMLIDKIIDRIPPTKTFLSSPEITQLVFVHDIKELRDCLVEYFANRHEIWLLFDNLDKNWKISERDDYEATILRCLLDASRKLQKMLLKRNVNFHSIVFIRNDIYSFFLENTTDRGKDQASYLNWDDPLLFGEILRLRVNYISGKEDTFEQVWESIFDLHVKGENSFKYIVNRTFMRPRDFLIFIHHSLQTAINRGHNRLTELDILHAEEAYSRDIFEQLLYEIRDIHPKMEEILYCFLEANRTMYESELIKILKEARIADDKIDYIIYNLLWFCFLGISKQDWSEKYAYSVGYDIKMLLAHSDKTLKNEYERIYSIHPAFSKVLELKQ
ncbi:MAG: hypothetical protein KJ915_07325 [Candidatus Omnitrophica bacterium]|nr:hypothetical protein [Candidatus Omnitrophota bacterium]